MADEVNYSEFNDRSLEGTEIGRDITDDEAAYFHDNGKDVGVWRVDCRTTCGKGETLDIKNSHIAKHYYREKAKAASNRTCG